MGNDAVVIALPPEIIRRQAVLLRLKERYPRSHWHDMRNLYNFFLQTYRERGMAPGDKLAWKVEKEIEKKIVTGTVARTRVYIRHLFEDMKHLD